MLSRLHKYLLCDECVNMNHQYPNVYLINLLYMELFHIWKKVQKCRHDVVYRLSFNTYAVPIAPEWISSISRQFLAKIIESADSGGKKPNSLSEANFLEIFYPSKASTTLYLGRYVDTHHLPSPYPTPP